jgi:3-methyladenine DNA glycosylase/8-oxoguanine DNA glycosylase
MTPRAPANLVAPGGDAPPFTATRHLHLDGPIDLIRTCSPLTDGGRDPSWALSAQRVERAMWTPQGPATLRVDHLGSGLDVGAWGDGAAWAVEHTARMLGIHRPPTDLDRVPHPAVRRARRARPGLRHGAGLCLGDVVTPFILAQRVTAREARTSWFRLVRRYGEDAPGPEGSVRLPPHPRTLVRLSDAQWHVVGVERQRADAVRRTLGVLPALERARAEGSARFQEVLRSIPGCGPWTATGLAGMVLGDPDAVLLGDLHLPHAMCHVLAGEPRGSDGRMLELLEPWRGHRGVVVRLLRSCGASAPRRGPRYTPLPISRM